MGKNFYKCFKIIYYLFVGANQFLYSLIDELNFELFRSSYPLDLFLDISI